MPVSSLSAFCSVFTCVDILDVVVITTALLSIFDTFEVVHMIIHICQVGSLHEHMNLNGEIHYPWLLTTTMALYYITPEYPKLYTLTLIKSIERTLLCKLYVSFT